MFVVKFYDDNQLCEHLLYNDNTQTVPSSGEKHHQRVQQRAGNTTAKRTGTARRMPGSDDSECSSRVQTLIPAEFI